MADPLWEEFDPIWSQIETVTPPVVLAGGYGLFLKQVWLQAQGPQAVSAIPLAQWANLVPRATQDIDLVLDLGVVANEEQQAIITRAIRARGFTDVSPLWKFGKSCADGRHVKVELHSVRPVKEHPLVMRGGSYTIKRRSSTSPDRLHTRANDEAVGGELEPCVFHWHGRVIRVPNPVTWSIMKMTAAADRWFKSHNELTPADREFHRLQAEKHAVDVGRIIGMMQVHERAHSQSVVTAVSASEPYRRACAIRGTDFAPRGFGMEAMRRHWDPAAVDTIGLVLATWFP
jgi:hypothetical protein